MSNCLIEPNRILCRLLLPILFLTSAALFAQNNQTVLPADWDKLQDLDRLFLESGLAVPFRTRPYSIEELKFYLKRINPSRLSTAGKLSLSNINADLKQRSLYSEEGALAFNTALILNLESYLHSDSSPELWLYGYEERLPMVSVPLDLWLFNTMYAHLSIDIKEGYRVTQLNPDNYFNLFSLEHNLVEADWNFPFRTFFALGGEHWLFQLGREQLNWGNGRTVGYELTLTNLLNILEMGGVSLYSRGRWGRYMRQRYRRRRRLRFRKHRGRPLQGLLRPPL
ncbi:hypothetical protein ES705_41499 [subsurface metagenome]